MSRSRVKANATGKARRRPFDIDPGDIALDTPRSESAALAWEPQTDRPSAIAAGVGHVSAIRGRR